MKAKVDYKLATKKLGIIRRRIIIHPISPDRPKERRHQFPSDHPLQQGGDEATGEGHRDTPWGDDHGGVGGRAGGTSGGSAGWRGAVGPGAVAASGGVGAGDGGRSGRGGVVGLGEDQSTLEEDSDGGGGETHVDDCLRFGERVFGLRKVRVR
jgi:hypothetical protein